MSNNLVSPSKKRLLKVLQYIPAIAMENQHALSMYQTPQTFGSILSKTSGCQTS